MSGAESNERLGRGRLLTERPIPNVSSEQLNRYRAPEALRKKDAGTFTPAHVVEVLRESEGKTVIGIDFGVDKIVRVDYKVGKGTIKAAQTYEPVSSGKDGETYLDYLKQIAREAEERGGIIIGMSAAGLVDGTRLLPSPTAGAFRTQLADEYDSDLAVLLPTVTAVKNDAEAAALFATLSAYEQGHLPAQEGTIHPMEPGHVELVNPPQPLLGKLISYEPCGMEGQEFPCVEQVVGGVKGIQFQSKELTGETLTGPEISDKYLQGNALAAQIYDNSATYLATGILGMGEALGLVGENAKTGIIVPVIGGGNGGAGYVTETPPGQEPKVTIAFHGGVFNVPGYQERVKQILEANNVTAGYLFTGKLSLNAGAEGAAIAALMATAA